MDAESVELRQRVDKLAQRPREAIIAINHNRIELSTPRVHQQTIESGSRLFGAGDALIDVLTDDLPFCGANSIREALEIASRDSGC